MAMLNWLKKKIRAWLLDEPAASPPPPQKEIEVYREGGLVKMRATGIAGLSLICSSPTGVEKMVSQKDARDKDHFHSLWKSLGGGTPTWEDGTPYDFGGS